MLVEAWEIRKFTTDGNERSEHEVVDEFLTVASAEHELLAMKLRLVNEGQRIRHEDFIGHEFSVMNPIEYFKFTTFYIGRKIEFR